MTTGKAQVSKSERDFEQAAPVCCTCKHFQESPGKSQHKCRLNSFAVWKISLCNDWVDKKTNQPLEVEQ